MSILTGEAIRQAIAHDELIITPLDNEQVDQAGVTLHLHPRLLVLDSCAWLDARTPCDGAFVPVPVDETGAFLLLPGRLYLGATIERIYAPRHVVRVDGKSSLGRKGLEVHRTAGHVEPGFDGQITLEMAVLAPLRIPPGWHVCQAVFHETVGEIEPYDRRGHYVDANKTAGPQPSRSHLHRARHA